MRQQDITVYLDMDGVLADFNAKTLELLGKTLNQYPDSASGWAAMAPYKHNLYKVLDPMPDAYILVNGVYALQAKYNFRLAVLTAIPKYGRIPSAKNDKKEWLLKYFPTLLGDFNIGPNAEHKHFHCVAGDVLIDDSEKNIPQWNNAEGYGILHTSAIDSIDQLDSYLYDSKIFLEYNIKV